MKGFINFINPFVGYIILPPFFTVWIFNNILLCIHYILSTLHSLTRNWSLKICCTNVNDRNQHITNLASTGGRFSAGTSIAIASSMMVSFCWITHNTENNVCCKWTEHSFIFLRILESAQFLSAILARKKHHTTVSECKKLSFRFLAREFSLKKINKLNNTIIRSWAKSVFIFECEKSF